VWSFVLLTDLAGEPIGEVTNAYDRKVTWRLNKATTCTFSVRQDDPLADVLMEGRALVKLYEDDLLRFVGDVVSASEKGADLDHKIEVTCSDRFWLLEHRLCGKSASGLKYTVATDRGQIFRDVLAATNAEADTGIRNGTLVASSSDTPGPWYFKPISEVISELSAALDGPDWRLTPVEPAVDGAYPYPLPVISQLDVAAKFSTYQPEAIFEFGTGRHNVKDYERAVSKQGLLTQGFSLPPGFPDAAQGAIQPASDTTAIGEWGLHEAVIPGDMADDALRLKVVAEHLRVRKAPKQVIAFTPVRVDTDGPPVPKFRSDYDVGDIVPFRAVVNDELRVNLTARVYGVDVAIDSEGAETVTPVLVGES
jgi:hypothetical protein